MKFHIITLFPESFDSYINESILARAQKSKLIKIQFYNPRDFIKPSKSQAKNPQPYLRADDKPYGGGPGMVMRAEPLLKILSSIKKKIKPTEKIKIIHLSPQGKKFDNSLALKYSKNCDHIIIVCGRYEGIDARVRKIFKGDELSIGDYVLTGGELPAMIILDAVSRQIKGVLGNFDSVEEKRSASKEVYTRPEIIEHEGKKYKVPAVLLGGNHAEIEKWRANKAKK